MQHGRNEETLVIQDLLDILFPPPSNPPNEVRPQIMAPAEMDTSEYVFSPETQID